MFRLLAIRAGVARLRRVLSETFVTGFRHRIGKFHDVHTRFRYRLGGDPVFDPFQINPIRRSAATVAGCAAVVLVPFLISASVAQAVMLAVGWMALAGLIFALPVLVWSVIEWAVREVRRRIYPGLDQLPLSPRLLHVLQRHGFDTIADVDRASDVTLLLLANSTARDVHELRRAVYLWKYRRWQEKGFPATGME